VPHIEIEPTAVEEKSAIARRFFIVAVMKIDCTGVGFAKEIIFDFRRPKLGIHVRLVFTEKTAVLGFDSYDAIHGNQLTHRIRIWLNQKNSSNLVVYPWGRGECVAQYGTNKHQQRFGFASPFRKGRGPRCGELSF
jgi:hypothetical protein